MKKIMAFCLMVSMLMGTLLLGGCGQKAENSGQQDEPQEITVYTALEEEQVPVYLKSFEEKYPDIKVNIVRDSTGIITSRLLAEKDNPQADVIWGLAATSLLVADQNGMLEPYAPQDVDKVLAEFKDTQTPPHWVGIDSWMTAITVNTEEMKKNNLPIPKSYDDLLNPAYKGMIVMPNPASSGTGFLTVSAWMQLFGEDKAWSYMDKLNDNVAMYTHSGSKPAKMAAAGECGIGVSFEYRGLALKEEGAPVEVVFPAEGSGWEIEANALVKKAEIKEAAKLFLDWAISNPAMQEYGKNYGITAIPVDVAKPAGYPAEPLKQLVKNDLNWAAANRERILAEWEKRYDAKSEAE